jgi:predicted ATPase/class 3 adenylate cyclase/DNA-binding CsgD family transcriptional regulator
VVGDLPTGTVTFLFTDLERSTELWEEQPQAMQAALARHDELLAQAAAAHGGHVVKGTGDGFLAAFSTASGAVAAAVAAQRALGADSWEPIGALRARMGLHSGVAEQRGDDYFGPVLARAARLMSAGHGGQILISRATEELVRDALPEGCALVDLGEHRLRDVSQPMGVAQVVHRDLPRVFPPLRVPDVPPHNLPVLLSTFVGREAELRALAKVLAEARLVTLIGSGGSGKTRLALRVAAEMVGRFPGGVWWVELAPLGDEELVGAAIAGALGVRPLPGMTPLQAAGAYLGSRRSLVVLDNCEHLVGACAEAAEALVRAGPDVVVVATSRAPLGVAGETDWRVPPLSLPTRGAQESDGGLGGAFDAVRLFVERAERVRPGFVLTDQNAASVAEICIELDGLPLAIELAAARVRLLSPAQIATGLSERFRLLTAGPRTAAARLQTLRASVDWSHDLLSAEEQALFRRVAVFVGGFTLAAGEQVCAGDGIEREGVLDLLGSLVDQSLVIAEERDVGMRYRVLETVRQYGLERLADAGEDDAVRVRHRDVFLSLAEQAGPHLETGRQREWLEVLDPEAANLAAAIDYALSSEPRLAMRFCVALHRWWSVRGRLAEAELAFARALDAPGERDALRARVLVGRGYVAINAGSEAAESYAAEALTLAEEVGDRATAARARCWRGGEMLWANPQGARAELAGAAELAREAGDDWTFVTAHAYIAVTYFFQNDHARFARANEEVTALGERMGEDPMWVTRRWFLVGSMAIIDGRLADARDAFERMQAVNASGDPVAEAWAEQGLARLDVWGGEPERALERLPGQLEHALKLGAGGVVPMLLEVMAFAELALGRLGQAHSRLEGLVPLVEGRAGFMTSWVLGLLAEVQRVLGDDAAEATALQAQASAEAIGNRFLATQARLTLGRLAAGRHDWTTAQQHALAHLDACVDGGHATYVPPCLDALAEVAGGLGNDGDAVRLLTAAERARAELGVMRVPPEDQHWAAIDAQLHDALGDDAYAAARLQGAELSIDDALAWARRARGPRRRPPSGWASLTPTEAKVVELVAQGLTNPQISKRMFISPATVKAHLAHIFKKLDVHTRAELSAHAVHHTTAT